MGWGCPAVLSKHLEVTSTHLEGQPCLVQLVLNLGTSLQIPPRRMDSKLRGDRLLSVGFRTLFLDCNFSYLDNGSSLSRFHLSSEITNRS